jgi:hypothetical protein
MTRRPITKAQQARPRAAGGHASPLLKPTVIATAVALALSGIPHALGQWTPNAEVLLKPGDERSYAGVDAVMPVWQSGRALLFADLKARLAEHDVREFNIGLGYRWFTDSQQWVLGGYLAADRRRTHGARSYNQVTIGAEALSDDWDFRANYYHPTTDRQLVGLGPTRFRGFGMFREGVYEEAMRGADFEIGRRLPFSEKIETRAFLAAYRFKAEDLGVHADGARLRVEVRPRQDIVLGLSVQHDNLFGTAWFAEVRYAFGKAPRQGVRKLTDRMTDPWTRDIDVKVTPPIEFRDGLAQQHPGVVVHVDSSKASGGNGSFEQPYSLVAACEAEKCADPKYEYVRLWKGNSEATPYTPVTLVSGKTLWGEGVDIFTNVTSPALQPKIVAAAGNAITLARNTTVAGVNARASTGFAIYGESLSGNIVIRNNTLSAGLHGIYVVDEGFARKLSSSVTITGNHITSGQIRYGNGIHVESGGVYMRAGFTRTQVVTISSNTLVGSTGGGAVRVSSYADRGSTVQTVTVTDNSSTAVDGGRMLVSNFSGIGGSAVQTVAISGNSIQATQGSGGFLIDNVSDRGRSTQSLTMSSNLADVPVFSRGVSVGNRYDTGGGPAGFGFARQTATLTNNTLRSSFSSLVTNSGVNTTQSATLTGNSFAMSSDTSPSLLAQNRTDNVAGTASQVLIFRGNTISATGPGARGLWLVNVNNYGGPGTPNQTVRLSGDTISSADAAGISMLRHAGLQDVRLQNTTINASPKVQVEGGGTCTGGGVPECP